MRTDSLPFDTRDIPAESKVLLGDSMGVSIADELTTEPLGVLIESPPRFDVASMLEAIAEESSYTIGLALSGIEEADVEDLRTQSPDSISITTELSDAIKWRNQTETDFTWGGSTVPDRIVVLVRGDPPKLGSLHRLSSLPLGTVRETICELMRSRDEFANNQPARKLWQALAGELDANLSLSAIAEYAVSCLKGSPQKSVDALGQELDKLHFFVDSNLLSDPDTVRHRLEENAELLNRTIHITNRDRKRLINSIKKADGDQQEQAEFIDRLRRFQRTTDESLLSELEFERVRDAFSTTSKRVTRDSTEDTDTDTDTTSSTRSRYDRRPDDSAVGVELSLGGNTEDLESLAEEFDESFEEGIEANETTAEFTYGDDEKLEVELYPDLSHFLQRFVTTDRFGGVIRGGDDRDDVITNFTAYETEFFTVDDDEGSFQKMRRFADQKEEFQTVVDAFDDYLDARERLLDHFLSFIHSPLTRLLGDDTLLESAQTYLEAYRTTQDRLDKKYRALQDASAKGARQLLSDFLLLDTIVLDTDNGRELLLSPIHPLHLWKYVELATEITENRDNLTAEDEQFLRDTIEEQPHVLTNITIGGGRLFKDETYLIQSGEEASLPVYTEADRSNPGDNRYLWDYLINKFTAAYPPSENHLKLTVVDPIQPHQLLSTIVSAAENEQIEGATVEFAYIGSQKSRLLAGATSNTEETIINLFGPEGNADDFNIVTREFADYDALNNHLAENQRHATVVNDQSSFYVEEFERDMETSINPLYVPKEFEYDAFEDTIDISASTEGRLFSEYQNLVNQLNNQRPKLHNAGVHELGVSQDIITALEENSIWVCLSTAAMNSDPFWTENLISRERRGDREYAIYSQDIDLFTRTLRRILNEYPIAPEDTDIEQVAHRIAETERSGLLRLITEETIGDQQSRNSKGLLGSIISVQWLEERFDDPKLIFSIDDPRTRSWLNFGESNRRADFIVVQYNDNDGLNLNIIEVKTLDEPDQAFQIAQEDGENRVTGEAVEQLTETTNTIRRLFEGEDNITTPPRREALREQLYYELIGNDVAGTKEEWAERVNNVFRGDGAINISPQIVSIEIGNSATNQITTDCITDERQELRVTRLPRKTVVRLIVNGTDTFEDTQEVTDREDTEVESGADETTSGASSETDEQPETDGVADSTPQTVSSDEKDRGSAKTFGDPEEYAEDVEVLKRVLHEFGIDVADIDPENVEVGPNLIRYKVELAGGQKQGPLESRSEDIAREMALEREPFIHRLPGTKYVAVDVPRDETEVVYLQDYLDQLPDREELTLGELPFVAGITPAGDAHQARLNEAPHMLVGGTTGSGKTVFLYSLLTCLLENFKTDEIRLGIVDPKLTNFMFFNQLPNLEHNQVITESEDAAELFRWIAEEEIPRRTQVIGGSGSIDINEHNQRSDDPLRPLVVVVDEYADLIDGLEDSDEFEKNVRRIAQKARSVGIHLVISTQRPSAQIIDTDLRANLDMRVAFRLPSASDSQVILDESGAEDLGGNGDMLFKEADALTRLQGTFVETDYIRDLIEELA